MARETRGSSPAEGTWSSPRPAHGFVCANAGVDASNVAEGFADAAARGPGRERGAAPRRARGALGRAVGGRGHRHVRPGVAARPGERRDRLRGAPGDRRPPRDAPITTGRVLEATIVAPGRRGGRGERARDGEGGRASRPPLVRGLAAPKRRPRGPRELVRPARGGPLPRVAPPGDLTRGARSARSATGEVPREALEEAVRAACTAPAPHHTRPWLFVALEPGPRAAPAPRRDGRGVARGPDAATGRPRSRSTAGCQDPTRVLGAAPVLDRAVRPVRAGAPLSGRRARRAPSGRCSCCPAGAAIQNLLLALHAQGLASCWVSSTLFCKEETREALGVATSGSPSARWPAGPMPRGPHLAPARRSVGPSGGQAPIALGARRGPRLQRTPWRKYQSEDRRRRRTSEACTSRNLALQDRDHACTRGTPPHAVRDRVGERHHHDRQQRRDADPRVAPVDLLDDPAS